jgi:hypothetical protein
MPVVLPLSRGYCAIIDDEDLEKVSQHKWHTHISKGKNKKPGQPYARATINGKKVYLHRFVMDSTDPSKQVDHGNHQTLDCRKCNLEETDHQTNQSRRRNCNKC